MARSWSASRIVACAVAVVFFGSGVLLCVPAVGKLLPTLGFLGSSLGVLILKQTRPELWESPRERIELTEHGVQRHLGNGQREQVAWSELTEVWIITTSEGPFVDDFFFILRAADGTGCAVPSTNAGDLLQRLQRLPRFDNEQIIRAVGSVEDARFICWQGSPGEGLMASAPG